MASVTRPISGDVRRSLLTADDPSVVRVVNPMGASSFLLIGDHAGNAIPQRLGTLGINSAERRRHIAWDIGVAALGELLADTLDAVFLSQSYSRLVVDCNRDPEAPDAIAQISDGTTISGNVGLDDNARAPRFAEIHEPYHAAIAAEIARRDAAGIATIVVSLHSFTPVYGTSPPRPWEIGILYDRGNTSFSLTCLTLLKQRGDLTVGDNEPYRMDTVDYTVPRHCYAVRRPYVEIEIRQDLLEEEDGAAAWNVILAKTLVPAASDLVI